MSREADEDVIFHALHELSSGWDYETTLSYLKSAREEFALLDKKALSLLANSSGNILEERFHQNQTVYTEDEPIQESVFLYVDLSTSVELLKYIVYLRNLIDECVGRDNIRYSDLRLQHSTIFTDFLGKDPKLNSELLDNARIEYEEKVKTLLPFNLTIAGPHIFDTGGIVLEGIVYSQQFYNLRETASEKNEHFPSGVHRQIHKIIHSTIGYLTGGTPEQLTRLFRHFESMRIQPVNISIRIRDIRIIATKNKRLIGQPIILPFQGTRGLNQKAGVPHYSLQVIRDLASSWSRNTELKNFVLEEVLYLIESNHTTDVQLWAKEIIDQW